MPVGVGGSRAGLRRSSTDDSHESGVAHRAPTLVSAIGEEIGREAGQSKLLETGEKREIDRRNVDCHDDVIGQAMANEPEQIVDLTEECLFKSKHKIMRTPPHHSGGTQQIEKSRETIDTIERTGGRKNLEKLRIPFLEVKDLEKRSQSAPTSPILGRVKLPWDDEGGRQPKRRRGDLEAREAQGVRIEDGDYALASILRSTIKDLERDIGILGTFAKEKNTKREIKELSVKLGQLVSRVTTEQVTKMLRHLEGCVQSGTRDQTETRSVKSTKEVGCQTTPEGLVTGEDIENVANYQDFINIADKSWNDKSFKCAFLAEGSPLKANKAADLVMIVENCQEGDSKVNELIKEAFEDRYPDLLNTEGSFTQLEIETKVIDSKGSTTNRSQFITKIELNDGEEEWFNNLQILRDRVAANSRKKIAVYPPCFDKNGFRTRKILECLFRKHDTRCLVYIKDFLSRGKRSKMKVKKKKEDEDEVVIVRNQHIPYAELLKQVKVKVQEGANLSESVRYVRKSRMGDVIINIQKGDESVVKEIKGRLSQLDQKDFTVRAQKRKLKTIYIKDMDGITTKEEVMESLAKVIGEPKGDIEIGELRPFGLGNQAATIRATEEIAGSLIGSGKIRIGINLCRIEERVEVPRCFKCNQYGHRRYECQNEIDCGTLCNNCGKQGHRLNNCTDSSFCLTCKVAGHRAGGGNCPEFKKALRRAKLRAKNKKRY